MSASICARLSCSNCNQFWMLWILLRPGGVISAMHINPGGGIFLRDVPFSDGLIGLVSLQFKQGMLSRKMRGDTDQGPQLEVQKPATSADAQISGAQVVRPSNLESTAML